MAFVSRADKNANDRKNLNPGPGSYINPSTTISNPTFVPFSSSSERAVFKNIKQPTPGPGTYEVASVPDPPQVDHWGHANFSSSFSSQNPRLPVNPIEKSPGPGSYLVKDSWKLKKKLKKPASSVSYIRVPSAPSIPANHQTFGYNETKSGDLVMQKNPEVIYSGTQKDSIGPGHYSVAEFSKIKGPSWVKTNEKRVLHKSGSTGPDLGPGTYTKVPSNPLYKYRQNAVFLSKFKEEALQVKDKNPLGPGEYEVSASSMRVKPKRFQSFGSSSLRFSPQKSETDLGPGHYSLSSKTVSHSKVPFMSNNLRFRYRSSSTPGPGSYKQNNLAEQVSKKVWGKQGVFGSSEKRFTNKSNGKNPGPGHYEAEEQREAHVRQNAVFLSKCKRSQSENNTAPPPGSYEVKSSFEDVKRNPVLMHPVLSKVTKCESVSELGFQTKEKRFDDRNIRKKQLLPGPGSYNVKHQKTAKKVIVAKESRFSNRKTRVPGPGAYMADDSWNRKSYNILFSEVT